ncbi:intradiol ring-cleavage dioxygenase [Glycomyces buryatensis]|uniref:3,4-dioxygenase subunit beta n=1 Tax=Glycomyces buryatensis TaxID=2570927 RepID=A0A4S8PPM5_9ACTN|nr:intradiol ring-cleavage dioxygenase [Glycomyces buryatensis]THV32877.1 3,4-dioxygenase subunit beta [Glycomyces buryatensis]
MPGLKSTERMYEGRPLDHPDEEVVDQGLRFDIDTIFSRRRMLGLAGAGTAAAVVAACGGESTPDGDPSAADSSELSEIPEETTGPFPGDGSNGADVLEESGVIRRDIRSSVGDSTTTAKGVLMTLELEIIDMANGNAPFEGVAVYVWHCSREGGYSMYSEGVEHENYLRGVQIADDAGKVTFTSIYPACYDGRWPHIHFEVYPDADSITDAANVIATSQVALTEEACDAVYAEAGYEQSVTTFADVALDTDMVFSDDGGASQTATVTGDVTSGYTVALTVGVDTGTGTGTGTGTDN